MTATSSILENFTALVADGKFSDESSKTEKPMMAFLKENDPNFPAGDHDELDVSWSPDKNTGIAAARYTALKAGKYVPVGHLSEDATTALATLLSQKGEHVPRIHGSKAITREYLEKYSAARNPYHDTVTGYFKAQIAVTEAKRIQRSTQLRMLWDLWAHADLNEALLGIDADARRQLAGLPLELRLEAVAILTFVLDVERNAMSLIKFIFPEFESFPEGFEGLLTKVHTPLTAQHWNEAVKHRAMMIGGYHELLTDPTASVAAWVGKARTPEESRKLALNVPMDVHGRWIANNLDSFPKAQPTEMGLDYLHWTFYACTTPEGLVELEKVFTGLTKGQRILLLRQNGQIQKDVNDILMRTSARAWK